MLKIGHRGVRGHAPENTLESFKRALSIPVDMIELDVRKSASGDLVCIHDGFLRRLTGKSGRIKKKTLKEIKEFSIKGEKIPTIYESLDLIDRKARVNIHLKGELSNEIYPVIKKYLHKGWCYDDFVVSSFSKKALKLLHSLDKNIRLGFLCVYPRFPRIPLYSVHPYYRLVRKRHIIKAHIKGLKVFVWTVNSSKQIRKLERWGIDGVISDYPERI